MVVKSYKVMYTELEAYACDDEEPTVVKVEKCMVITGVSGVKVTDRGDVLFYTSSEIHPTHVFGKNCFLRCEMMNRRSP